MVLHSYVPPEDSLLTTRALANELVALIPDKDTQRICEKSLLLAPDIVLCVKAFHKLYGLPVLRPSQAREDFSHIAPERLAMRFALIEEEYIELCEAMDFKVELSYSYMNEDEEWVPAEDLQDAIVNTENRDMGGVGDACEDLKYVITGFELEMGIDPHACLEEVQASNLTKMGDDGLPLLREDGKVLKGPMYQEADCDDALRTRGMMCARPGPLSTAPYTEPVLTE